jgi:ketosteroid isomerase-like protein
VDASGLESLADRFFAAIEAGDVATLRTLYHPDAAVWHNSDQVDQPVEENLRVLGWLRRTVPDLRYTEVRRTLLPDGFVQQHVLRGTATGGELAVPAMLRFTVGEDGRVTRIEEYLDTRQVDVLRHHA